MDFDNNNWICRYILGTGFSLIFPLWTLYISSFISKFVKFLIKPRKNVSVMLGYITVFVIVMNNLLFITLSIWVWLQVGPIHVCTLVSLMPLLVFTVCPIHSWIFYVGHHICKWQLCLFLCITHVISYHFYSLGSLMKY